MPNIDWNARLDEKYRILAQNSDADTIRANAAMVSAGADVDKAGGYVNAVANDYDINKQRFNPGGLEERIATNRNQTELQKTAMDNAAMAGVRGATANLYGKQAVGVGLQNKFDSTVMPSKIDEVMKQSKFMSDIYGGTPAVAQPKVFTPVGLGNTNIFQDIAIPQSRNNEALKRKVGEDIVNRIFNMQ